MSALDRFRIRVLEQRVTHLERTLNETRDYLIETREHLLKHQGETVSEAKECLCHDL